MIVRCDECRGTGKITIAHRHGEPDIIECDYCDGTGRVERTGGGASLIVWAIILGVAVAAYKTMEHLL